MDQNSKEKKLFFFGQPGCLKVKFDIPIRPENSDSTSNDNEIGEKAASVDTSESKLIDDKITTKNAENSSDDDAQELLKQIDAVLQVKSKHQNEDISANETDNNSLGDDTSNSNTNDISSKSIQNESNKTELLTKSVETSTNEESHEKSALQEDSSACIATITENIENVDSVKIVEVNNDEKLVNELKSEEVCAENLDIIVEKTVKSDIVIEAEELSKNVENIQKHTDNIVKTEIKAPKSESSLEDEKMDIEPMNAIPIEEKSLEENIEDKNLHSENIDSMSVAQTERQIEEVEPMLVEISQNESQSESDKIINTDHESTSNLNIKECLITEKESQDDVDKEKPVELHIPFSQVVSSEIQNSELISEVSEERNENSEIKIDVIHCPSHKLQVLSNETSIKSSEQSVPKNDSLEHKIVDTRNIEEPIKSTVEVVNTFEEKKLNISNIENVESQIQDSKTLEAYKNENLENISSHTDKQKDKSEAQIPICQSNEENSQQIVLPKDSLNIETETTECRINLVIETKNIEESNQSDEIIDQGSTLKNSVSNDNQTPLLEITEQNEVISTTNQNVRMEPDVEILEEISSSEHKNIEHKESSSVSANEKLNEKLTNETQIDEEYKQNIALFVKSPLHVENIKESDIENIQMDEEDKKSPLKNKMDCKENIESEEIKLENTEESCTLLSQPEKLDVNEVHETSDLESQPKETMQEVKLKDINLEDVPQTSTMGIQPKNEQNLEKVYESSISESQEKELSKNIIEDSNILDNKPEELVKEKDYQASTLDSQPEELNLKEVQESNALESQPKELTREIIQETTKLDSQSEELIEEIDQQTGILKCQAEELNLEELQKSSIRESQPNELCKNTIEESSILEKESAKVIDQQTDTFESQAEESNLKVVQETSPLLSEEELNKHRVEETSIINNKPSEIESQEECTLENQSEELVLEKILESNLLELNQKIVQETTIHDKQPGELDKEKYQLASTLERQPEELDLKEVQESNTVESQPEEFYREIVQETTVLDNQTVELVEDNDQQTGTLKSQTEELNLEDVQESSISGSQLEELSKNTIEESSSLDSKPLNIEAQQKCTLENQSKQLNLEKIHESNPLELNREIFHETTMHEKQPEEQGKEKDQVTCTLESQAEEHNLKKVQESSIQESQIEELSENIIEESSVLEKKLAEEKYQQIGTIENQPEESNCEEAQETSLLPSEEELNKQTVEETSILINKTLEIEAEEECNLEIQSEVLNLEKIQESNQLENKKEDLNLMKVEEVNLEEEIPEKAQEKITFSCKTGEKIEEVIQETSTLVRQPEDLNSEKELQETSLSDKEPDELIEENVKEPSTYDIESEEQNLDIVKEAITFETDQETSTMIIQKEEIEKALLEAENLTQPEELDELDIVRKSNIPEENVNVTKEECEEISENIKGDNTEKFSNQESISMEIENEQNYDKIEQKECASKINDEREVVNQNNEVNKNNELQIVDTKNENLAEIESTIYDENSLILDKSDKCAEHTQSEKSITDNSNEHKVTTSLAAVEQPIRTEDLNETSHDQNLKNLTEPKEILLKSSNEEQNKNECSTSAENINTSQEGSDKPEVLNVMSKDFHKHADNASESKYESENFDSIKVSSPCDSGAESSLQKIGLLDNIEYRNSNEIQESKIKIESKGDSLSSSNVIQNDSLLNAEVEAIPQKSITVEENSNEKINDNQVELSKIDNKSSSLEKVSPLQVINIQNEISEDLSNTNPVMILEEISADEKGSVVQPEDKIQLQIDDKSKDENIKDNEVELKEEKENKSTNEYSTDDKLTDIIDDGKCKINDEVSKDVVIENSLEKVNLNEISVKEVCSRESNETQEDSKHNLESNEKSAETIALKTENVTINVEASNELLSSDTLIDSEKSAGTINQNVENVILKQVELEAEVSPTKSDKEQYEPPLVDPLAESNVEVQSSNVFDNLFDKESKLESIPITKSFQKPAPTRKRKMSERKSISESDSDGGSHFVTDSVSNEKSSDEETVATKKPRIRNKITATRNMRATRQSAKALDETKVSSDINVKQKIELNAEEKKDEEKTIQNFKFDYDENEDIASKMAAIKTLICKDTPKKDGDNIDSNESSADESSKKKPVRRGRQSKRGRTGKKNDAQESSSDDSKSSKVPNSKRSKTSESEENTAEKQTRKKRESAGKGLLKYIDTSLVIETVETETPIRQSRRIAQQKIREETERRQMEEKMLKQMKAEAEKKKKMALIPEPPDDDDHSSDESYKDSTRKKKTKIKASDKQWQTSSSHSEKSESEDDFERPPSEDPGSPLFRSDHEFSPESDDDEAPAQPIKRARTAKKQVEESSDEEDVNPIHACQVCHKTDSPEWILLCDECDHGYHCSCLKPIIFLIPSGNWYCPLCCHKKLVDDLSVQLEKLDTLILDIKAEEVRQQKQLEIKKLAEITQENILNDKRKNRSEINAKVDKSAISKSRDESSKDDSESNDNDSSENSSDNEPLNEISYKLRRRNQITTSYRFNDYDDLINSAIKRDMDEVKGMGNAGRGKDISTIIEADKEEKKQQKMDKDSDDENEKANDQQEGESSGSEIIRPKKTVQRKKKNRKLNNLDATSEEDQASDEDFKGTPSTNSDTEEEYSASSNDVSESSLDLPVKKGKGGKRSTRSAAKNRRYDQNFIDDNSSDDEPLIKKRIKKQIDSDEEDFDINEENSDGSTPEDIDSEDLCDDTESDDSSESNWPKKKKKRNASYDIKKPRRNVKKTDGGKDKAFRAGISKKKILKQSENESEASEESDKGRRRTRGKKLLYLIEDDYESDDGIKPGIGVVRPETPPEERELFVKKQEEIKRMLAEKNTEAARQLAVPTIEPIHFALEKPTSPVPPPLTSDELSSLSTIPKNVIEGAKALDMDYNKIKPIHFGMQSKSSDHPSAHDMSEEDLARMMEEEDFAQHQLKMVGETINRNKLLELEVKEEAFLNIGKGAKMKEEKDTEKPTTSETKKRARKPKQEKQSGELSSPPAKIMQNEAVGQKISSIQHIAQPNIPVSTPSLQLAHESTKPHGQNIPSVPPLISNPITHHPYPTMPPRYPGPHHLNIQDRPSVLSNYIPRHEGMPPRLEGMPSRLEGMPPRLEGMRPRLEGMRPRLDSMLSRLEGMGPRIQGMPPRLEGMRPQLEGLPPRLEGMRPRMEGITSRLEGMAARLEVGSPQLGLRFPHQSPEGFPLKSPQATPQVPPSAPVEEVEEKKKGRRKKYTPLRTDLVDSNASKVAKLETPTTTSVIHSTLNLSTSERPDDKSKASLPPLQRTKPDVFNPATSPSSSVISRLLQPQQRPPFSGIAEQMNASTASPSNLSTATTPRAFPEDMKHLPMGKQVRPGQQSQFPENPFVPRGMHALYRGPPTTQPSIYGIPPHHARIPYPFHLHPNNNLRPNMQEYGAPYNIPPQFGYYAPPAHSRQPPNTAAPPLSHQEHPEIPPNNVRPSNVNPNEEPSESSEFGGLVSYFSSQQELD